MLSLKGTISSDSVHMGQNLQTQMAIEKVHSIGLVQTCGKNSLLLC